MPDSLTYRRRLRMIVLTEGASTLCVALEGVVTLPNGAEQTFALPDEYPEEADVQARAEADGRTTWDQSDVCAIVGCERAPTPAPVMPRAEPPAPPPGHERPVFDDRPAPQGQKP